MFNVGDWVWVAYEFMADCDIRRVLITEIRPDGHMRYEGRYEVMDLYEILGLGKEIL